MSAPRILSCIALLVYGLECCLGQQAGWSINNHIENNTLTQCQEYQINVQAISSQQDSVTPPLGVPPYYMFAFAAGGIPSTSLLGSDPNNLTWQVGHVAGSTLLLQLADSVGTSGGIAGPFRVNGSDSNGPVTNCLPPMQSDIVTMQTNVTNGNVSTCDPIGFWIEGGVKPYNITLAAPGQRFVTNLTMGPTDDVFIYIDRTDPDGQLLVAVSDRNGAWGTSSQLLSTSGSTNTDCIGLVSSTHSFNSSVVRNPYANPGSTSEASSNSTTRSPPVVAVVIPVLAVVLLLSLGYLLWRRRRHRFHRPLKAGPAILPVAWVESFSKGSSPGLSQIQKTLTHGIPVDAHIPPAPSQLSTNDAEMRVGAGPEYSRPDEREPNDWTRPSYNVIHHRDGGAAPPLEFPPPYADHIPPPAPSASMPVTNDNGIDATISNKASNHLS